MNKFLENKTVLFIAPLFYDYEKIITKQIAKEGASVIFFPEREYGIRFNLINNFRPKSLIKLQENYYAKIYTQIKDIEVDFLFIIRGFLMPLNFIEKINKKFPKVTLIMHQWDSMQNNNYEECLTKFDKFFSFDPLDCSKHKVLKYLPNFYLPEYETLEKVKPLYDISFIGWAYKKRIEILKKIEHRLPQKSIFKYCYMPPSSYFKNAYKSISLQDVKFRSISLAGVRNIVQQSFSVLDITDPKQSGYTYRSIDAIAAGKKLITTNHFIKNESFYNEDNILIINQNNPQITSSFFEKPFKAVDVSQYSLENWIKKIFES